MTSKAKSQQRWDLLGMAQILEARGWLSATNANGEIIIRKAFDPNKTSFKYDSQEFAYQKTLRLTTTPLAN